jgi:hypothetical protein
VKECDDDVFDSSDEDEEEEKVQEVSDGESPQKFPKAFIFTCIGIGLTNFARKIE